MSSSSSGPARVSLRAPPHLPFVQGWPGIPPLGNRPAAAVHGTVEVRVGVQPVRAKWVRVEVRKFESLPVHLSKNEKATSWDHVGDVVTLWKAPEGKDFETLSTADFRFVLPLPTNIPPSFEMAKGGGGVRYELVAAVCYKQKGGIFRKDASSITTTTEPLRIIKHELHSAWPVYNSIESRSAQALNGQVSFTIERQASAFGPSDRILLTATLKSHMAAPFRLKGFDLGLVEVTTFFPPAPEHENSKKSKSKPPAQPQIKRTPIATSRSVLNASMGKGGEKSARLDLVVPSDRPLVTVQHARAFEVAYELVIEAVCDGTPGKITMPGIKCILGTLARSSAQQAIRDIGFVEGLCPGRPPPGQVTPSRSVSGRASLNGGSLPTTPPIIPRPTSMQPANLPQSQQIQGFIARDNWRRKSSGTTTTTTTTTTAEVPPPGSPPPERNYSTLPNAFGRATVSFPSPTPALHLSRSGSSPRSPASPTEEGGSASAFLSYRTSQSDVGHGEERNPRLSTATAATFGRWDAVLRDRIDEDAVSTSSRPQTPKINLMPGTGQSSGPSRSSVSTKPLETTPTWLSADNEKQRLYEEARARAAASQHASGASLTAIGLDDVAPPEYAPPRPAKPLGEAYMPPSRPVSTYGSRLSFGPGPGPGPTSPPPKTPSPINRPVTTPTPRPPPAPVASSSQRSVSMPKEYLSAAQEKELQRQRYENAQQRVVSGGADTNADFAPTLSSAQKLEAAASSSNSRTTPTSTKPFPSAAEEKERLRYEAAVANREQVAGRPITDLDPIPYTEIFSAAGSSSLIGPSKSTLGAALPPPSLPPPAHAAYLSAAEEKEAMRKRYEEAQDRVARTQGPSSSPPPASPPQASSSRPQAPTSVAVSTVYPSAAEEKELMRRRYEEAQERVAQSQAPAPSSPSPPVSPPQASANRAAPPAAYLSAAEEKDLMRRRYEDAQERVARGSGIVEHNSPTLSTTTPLVETPAAIPAPSPGPSASPQPRAQANYLDAAQEKELMRQRFADAQRAVARAQGNSSPVFGSQSLESPRRSPAPSPMQLSSAHSSSAVNISRYSTPPPSSPSFPFPSASEEKDLMRKRYAEAAARVEQSMARGSGVPGGSTGVVSLDSPAPAVSRVTGAFSTYNSTANTGIASASNFSSAQLQGRPVSVISVSSPPDSPLVARDPAVKAGKARAVSGVPSGLPPPLPAKPPREYIDLLSPVNGFAPFSSAANGRSS